jgi:hypothetical protein
MKRSLGIVTMVVAAVVLVAGVVIGLMPVKASIIQLQPQLRLLSASCGNGYLQTTPPVLQGNLVQLPDEPGVYLAKDSYAQQCAHAVGWRKYVAWALTAIGVLGLAVTLAGANSRSGPEPTVQRGVPARSKKQASKGNRAATKHAAKDNEEAAEYAGEYAHDEAQDPPASAGSGGAHRRRDR